MVEVYCVGMLCAGLLFMTLCYAAEATERARLERRLKRLQRQLNK